MKQKKIKPKQAKKLIDIFISNREYQAELAGIWGKDIVLGNDIVVGEMRCIQMRQKSESLHQKGILDEIFGVESKIKEWEELDSVTGYYVDNNSYISEIVSLTPNYKCRNVAPTREHCKSMLAFAMLSQICEKLGDECRVNWEDYEQIKYYPVCESGNIFCKDLCSSKQFFAFKTDSVCCEFIERNKGLLKQYFMVDSE